MGKSIATKSKQNVLKKILYLIDNATSLYIGDTSISCGVYQVSGVEDFFNSLMKNKQNNITAQQAVFLFFFYIMCTHNCELLEKKFIDNEYLLDSDIIELEDTAFNLFSVTHNGLPPSVLEWFMRYCLSHSGFRVNPNSGNEIIVFIVSYKDYFEQHFDKVLKTFK